MEPADRPRHEMKDALPATTRSPVAAPPNTGLARSIGGAIVLALGVAFVALKSLPEYNARPRPVYDELTYLELANDLAEAGGWRTFLPRSWSGDYREANRHPLYLLVLSSLAERDPSFYPRAKLASWLISVATTALVLAIVMRLAGAGGAVIVALMLGHNVWWLSHMPTIGVEMLLFAWLMLVWWFVAFRPDSTRWQTLAGACLGLALLTKGTALLVIAAFALAILLTRGLRAARSRSVWAFVLAWFVVSSPLLIRNVRVFGSPFYNVNSKYMWLDDWSQVLVYDDAEIEQQSLGRFIERRGVGELGMRVANGALRELSYLIADLCPLSDRLSWGAMLGLDAQGRLWHAGFTAQTARAWTTFVFGVLIFVIGLVGIRRLPQPNGRAFSWLTVAAFLAALSLHAPHASHPRFQLTLVPLVYATAALQCAAWVGRFATPAGRAGVIIVAIVLAVTSIVWQRTLDEAWPPRWFAVAAPPAAERELARWLAEHQTDRDVLALAPRSDFSPLWYTKIAGRTIGCPIGLDHAGFSEWTAKRGVTRIVLHAARLPEWANDWPREVAAGSESAETATDWELETRTGDIRLYRRVSRERNRDDEP